MNKSEFIRFLSAFEISYGKIGKILDAMNGEYSFEKFCFSDEIENILGQDYSSIAKKANLAFFSKYLSRLQEKGISLLTCEDELYPEKLNKLENKPYYLFYKGDISLLSQKIVAIVGTRSPSSYGTIVTQRIASSLARAGAVIVSGLAYGIDGISHREALKEGKTIAVLAGGFDNVYPQEHFSLFEQIAEKGLVICEYRPDVKVTKYSFLNRNRIVAALADALVITEAGLKSGTISTKDFAMDCSVPIYAVPGNITSPKSEGTNAMIASMQANCLLDEKTLIADLNLTGKKAKAISVSFDEQKIVDAVKDEPKSIDEICEQTKISISLLNSLLTSLEIKGIIKRMPGGMIALG